MLPYPLHLEAGDFVNLAMLQRVKGDFRPHGLEGNREEGLALLGGEGLFEAGMDAVDLDPVAGNIGRSEEGKPLEVIPVEVRQEEVVNAPDAAYRLAEIPQTGSGVAENVFFSAADLDAGTVAAVAPPDGEG